MKRHGNLFDKITSYENLYLAYTKASKGKHWQNTVKSFEENLDANLRLIQTDLVNKTFTTSPYSMMKVYEPKERSIYRLPFYPDRIVQHAIMNVLEPIWDKLFIYDSYSCRKGKGIHAGSRRTMGFIRRGGKNAYCLKMDIAKFYPSIDHDILFRIINCKIKCPETLWLLKDIIYSMPGKTNVPIGNYTSQWFGNLYLNELDSYLKLENGVKYYVRYCDDFIVIHHSKPYLNKLAKDIETFIQSKLNLKFSKCDLFPVSRGIDFLGYRHFPWGILIRKSTVKRMKRRLRQLPYELKHGHISQDQYRSSLASVHGWLKWANSYNLSTSMGLNELGDRVS